MKTLTCQELERISYPRRGSIDMKHNKTMILINAQFCFVQNADVGIPISAVFYKWDGYERAWIIGTARP